MKYIKYSLIAIMVLAFMSCNVLDQEPVSIISQENFYQNAAQAEAAVSGAYDLFQAGSIGRDLIASRTAGGDQAITDPSTGGNNNRMNSHSIIADHGPARDTWRESYTAIHRANDIVRNLPEINDPALEIDNKGEQLLGEARFIRGYFYWNLVKWYGGVPLVLNTTTSSDPAELNLPRTPAPEIYDQIIEDLTFASENLPVEYDSEEFTRGRATVGAANGFLAKVYLRRAWSDFAQPDDFQNAADRAQRVIENTALYELVPAENYGTIFSATAGNTRESIFEVQTEQLGLNEGADLYNEFEDRDNPGDTRARILPSDKLRDALNANPGDIRLTSVYSPMDPATNNGYDFYCTKYNLNGGIEVPNVVLLRLADLLLVRAEALNELGMTGEAVSLLNQVRSRAQIPAITATTQDEVFQAIQDERFVELAFEGQRWHDLSRFPANNYEFARNEFAEGTELEQMDENETHQLLWPINNRELDINDNLVQNPGYN